MEKLIITERGIRAKEEAIIREQVANICEDEKFLEALFNQIEQSSYQDSNSDFVFPYSIFGDYVWRSSCDLRRLHQKIEDKYEVVSDKKRRGLASINDMVFFENENTSFVRILTNCGFDSSYYKFIPFRLFSWDVNSHPYPEDSMYGKKVGEKFRLHNKECMITKILSPRSIQRLMKMPDLSKNDPTKVEPDDIVFFKNLHLKRAAALVKERHRVYYAMQYREEYTRFDNLTDILLGNNSMRESTELEYADLDEYFNDTHVGDVIPIRTYGDCYLNDKEESLIVGTMTPKTFQKRFLP